MITLCTPKVEPLASSTEGIVEQAFPSIQADTLIPSYLREIYFFLNEIHYKHASVPAWCMRHVNLPNPNISICEKELSYV